MDFVINREKIKCKGDKLFEEYVWSNSYKPSGE